MKRMFLAVALIAVTSCNDSKIDISKTTIKQLSADDFQIPSRYSFLYLFVSVEGHEKASLNINDLHRVFLAEYSTNYGNFEKFLSDALNQKIEFSKQRLTKANAHYFILNSTVKDFYRASSMASFTTKYSEKKDDTEYVIREDVVDNDLLYSVLYYFFINNFQVLSDDYTGQYFIRKVKN